MGDSMWTGDKSRYLTNPTHPVIREELDAYKRREGVWYGEPLSDAQRRAFDMAMIEKYAERETPPDRTRFVLQIWGFTEPER